MIWYSSVSLMTVMLFFVSYGRLIAMEIAGTHLWRGISAQMADQFALENSSAEAIVALADETVAPAKQFIETSIETRPLFATIFPGWMRSHLRIDAVWTFVLDEWPEQEFPVGDFSQFLACNNDLQHNLSHF